MTNGGRLWASRTACKTVKWDNIWCANPSVHSNSVTQKNAVNMRGGGGVTGEIRIYFKGGLVAQSSRRTLKYKLLTLRHMLRT